MTRFFIEKGANVNIQNDAPLRVAVQKGYTDIVRLLLEAGADPRAEDADGPDSPLRISTGKGKRKSHGEIVQLLLSAGAPWWMLDDGTVMNWAQSHTSSMNALNYLMIKSVLCGKSAAVRKYLRLGADVHARDWQGPDAAIRIASLKGNSEIVRILIEHGADIHARTDEALRSAAENGNNEVIHLLIHAGANVDAWENKALRTAVNKNQMHAIEILLDAGADITILKDNIRFRPFLYKWANKRLANFPEDMRLLNILRLQLLKTADHSLLL